MSKEKCDVCEKKAKFFGSPSSIYRCKDCGKNICSVCGRGGSRLGLGKIKCHFCGSEDVRKL